jgi:hypothetical protein
MNNAVLVLLVLLDGHAAVAPVPHLPAGARQRPPFRDRFRLWRLTGFRTRYETRGWRRRGLWRRRRRGEGGDGGVC